MKKILVVFVAITLGLLTLQPIQAQQTNAPPKALPPEKCIDCDPPGPPIPSPSVVGQWSAPVNWGFVVIHSHVLPNGRVLFWTRDKTAQGGDVLGSTQAQVWDPVINSFTVVPNTTTNLFCSGHSFLPDGRLLVAGGHKQFDGRGEPHTNIFDFTTYTWTRGPDMNAGRWYPTTCPLGNGENLVVSGSNENGALNTTPQVWQPSTSSWRSLTTATEIGQDLFPWMLLAPTGQVFYSGPTQTSRYLKLQGRVHGLL